MSIGAALAAFGALGTAPAAAAPIGPLGQSGRWITDARSRVVILHGEHGLQASAYHPFAAGFDPPDARFLARAGLNGVRLGIIYAGVEPRPGSYDDRWLDRIARTFTSSRASGSSRSSTSTRTCTTSAFRARGSRTGRCRTTACRRSRGPAS